MKHIPSLCICLIQVGQNKGLLVQRLRHKAGKLKERPLPKKKSVKDQQEEFEDEGSEMKKAEGEEDSSDEGGQGGGGFIGV